MSGGDTKLFQQIGSYTGDLLLGEIENNRELLIVMIALAFAFALLRNFSSVFQNSYVSQLCFLLVYVELMVLLMKSFAVVGELLTGTLDQIVEFMKVLLPVFCMSMVFSNGTTTASGFYEMAFLIIFLLRSEPVSERYRRQHSDTGIALTGSPSLFLPVRSDG